MIPLATVGERLCFARERAGLTQSELAKRAGVSQGTIGNIESGTRNRPRNLLKIARALGVSPDWLESGAGSMRGAPQADASASAWPFELISREQWDALSERQRGAVESAALRAMNGYLQPHAPASSDGESLAELFEQIQPGPMRERIHTMLMGALQDPQTHLSLMARLLSDPSDEATPSPAARNRKRHA